MEKFDLYKDIQMRTGGEIYVGIVGPVRTGKSTFVRKFAESLVLPRLGDEQEQARARDEMPASASGRTVTTVEPKFIPREAARIDVGDGTSMKVRLVDCVGFLVPGAEGTEEDGAARMVKTPWQDAPMPFEEAARMGTEKVITDHATIGIVITTDGSFGEIPRSSFPDAEREAITRLQKIGKPFLVIVNSAKPYGDPAKETAEGIWSTYGAACVTMNCEQMGMAEIQAVFEQFLLEFPLSRIVFRTPRWTETLDNSHWLKQDLFQCVKKAMQGMRTVRDVYDHFPDLDSKYIKKAKVEQVDLAAGNAEVSIQMPDSLYYEILSEMTGTDIRSEYQLISLVREMSKLKNEYLSVASAISAVKQTGYGIITPAKEEIRMEEPAIMKQGGKYGVRVRASAPSIHLIRAEIETEIAPIVGNESQARDLISYMKESGQGEEGGGNTLIFGKSVDQMVEEGIRARLASVSEESQEKLQNVMKRIVNDSAGKLICIII